MSTESTKKERRREKNLSRPSLDVSYMLQGMAVRSRKKVLKTLEATI